jgi:hypothetical protein
LEERKIVRTFTSKEIKVMEIVKLINDTWQLIDSSNGSVITQGTWDECFARMASLENENESYAQFLGMTGI